MHILSKIKHLVLQGLPIKDNSYPKKLPPELSFWYVYLLDSGHSVFAVLEEHESEAFKKGNDIKDYLCPVPVLAAIESSRIREGIIIITHFEVSYSPEIGLQSPRRMDEF